MCKGNIAIVSMKFGCKTLENLISALVIETNKEPTTEHSLSEVVMMRRREGGIKQMFSFRNCSHGFHSNKIKACIWALEILKCMIGNQSFHMNLGLDNVFLN